MDGVEVSVMGWSSTLVNVSPCTHPSCVRNSHKCVSKPVKACLSALTSSPYSDFLMCFNLLWWLGSKWNGSTTQFECQRTSHFIVSLCGCVDALCFSVLPFESKATKEPHELKAVDEMTQPSEHNVMMKCRMGCIWSRKGVV